MLIFQLSLSYRYYIDCRYFSTDILVHIHHYDNPTVKDIYQTPKSELNDEHGIDGKTCPLCGGKLKLRNLMHFNFNPNEFECPNCGISIRFNLASWVVRLTYFASVVYFILIGVLLRIILKLEGYFYVQKFLLFGLVPVVLWIVIFFIYCRNFKKLVKK